MKKRLIFSTIIALILVWLPSAIAEAQTSKGKEAITMDFNNEPLPAIFKRLEKVSVYKVLFSYQNVEHYRSTGRLKGATIDKAMQVIIGSHPLAYDV